MSWMRGGWRSCGVAVSRATHARFLARQAAEREAELDAPLTECRGCGGTLTKRMRRAGQTVAVGPGVVMCQSCYLASDDV